MLQLIKRRLYFTLSVRSVLGAASRLLGRPSAEDILIEIA
jgi:hypothetical protein